MTRNSLLRLFSTAFVVVALTACGATPTREATGEYVDDSVITTKVKAALLKDPVVSGLAVNVETFRGTVQLSGFVKTGEERARAVELAREVTGVQSIKNDILLR